MKGHAPLHVCLHTFGFAMLEKLIIVEVAFLFSKVNSFRQSLQSLMHDFPLTVGWTCFARLWVLNCGTTTTP